MASSLQSSSLPTVGCSSEKHDNVNENNSQSLLIICKSSHACYIYKIGIKQDGLLDGCSGDYSPLVRELIEGKEAGSLEFANIGSKLYMAGRCIREETLETQALDCILEQSSDGSDVEKHTVELQLEKQSFDRTGVGLKIRALDVTDGTLFNHFTNCSLKPLMLVGAFGKIYALFYEDPYDNANQNEFDNANSSLFRCFNPTTERWEPLSPPPFSSLLSVRFAIEVTGYAVLDQHKQILFCCKERVGPARYISLFYSFNVESNQWKEVMTYDNKLKGKIEESKYNPYLPFKYCTSTTFYDTHDGVNYPFYGKAEVVEDLIVGYLLRTVVTYQYRAEGDTVSLEPPNLCHKASYPSTMSGSPDTGEFVDAPVFQAPIGLPLFQSRCITHLGDKVFCAVETLEEWPGGSTFPVVYINTFRLEGDVLAVRDSTARVLGVGSNYKDDYLQTMFCFTLFNHQIKWNQTLATGCPPDLEKLYLDKVTTLCNTYFHSSSIYDVRGVPTNLHARLLFSRWKPEFKKLTDPFVSFLYEYMRFDIEGNPPPDPFQLVESVEKVCLEKATVLDSARHVFMLIADRQRPKACALYKFEVCQDGAIRSDKISPVTTVISSLGDDSSFLYEAFALVDDNVYLISGKYEKNDSYCSISKYSVVDKKETKFDGEYKIEGGRFKGLRILSVGLKIYFLPDSGYFCFSSDDMYFKCFNTISGVWETLEPPPFEGKGESAQVLGYAIVGSWLLISLGNSSSNSSDVYCYNVSKNKWRIVYKPEGSEDREDYASFRGRGELVDGTIYFLDGLFLFRFDVEETQGSLCLHPPCVLGGLDIVDIPCSWEGPLSRELTYLGNHVFCGIQTGECCLTIGYQYAIVTLFSVDGGCVRTLHSKICVLDLKGLDTADIVFCCSRVHMPQKRKARRERRSIGTCRERNEESGSEKEAEEILGCIA